MKSAFFAAAAMALGYVTSANATVLGLPDPNYGTLWDTFSSVTFSDATGTGSNPFMAATLSSTSGSGSITGGGDRLYSGNGGSTAAVGLTISGTASVELDSITVYLKYTAASNGQVLNYFTVTLDGQNGTQFSLGPTTEVVTGQNMNIVSVTWTGLDIDPNEAFSISISRPAAGPGQPGHVSIDAVQVVPEPTTGALIAAGLGLAALSRRRRSLN